MFKMYVKQQDYWPNFFARQMDQQNRIHTAQKNQVTTALDHVGTALGIADNTATMAIRAVVDDRNGELSEAAIQDPQRSSASVSAQRAQISGLPGSPMAHDDSMGSSAATISNDSSSASRSTLQGRGVEARPSHHL